MIRKLIRYLQKSKNDIYIQTHNFPDNDAIASAFGLQYLLSQYRIQAAITYDGNIQRHFLIRMIKELDIHIRHSETLPLKAEDEIIIVDGCKGNKNITDLIGDEIAVIDHHLATSPEDVRFSDIRPSVGSCSSIIASYMKEMKIRPTEKVATALLIGIHTDTYSLKRKVHKTDLDAVQFLYPLADENLTHSILRNIIRIEDLVYYRQAITQFRREKNFLFFYFPQGCDPNLLGILGDFFLTLNEINFVVLCANNEGEIFFSLRNENPDWNASWMIQEVLQGIGFGGGHREMAGGIIKDENLFNEDQIFKNFLKIIFPENS
jgi:nanoRNase/pAp phosphatase (c-di-AMP/oligoRNAs hydrolase)